MPTTVAVSRTCACAIAVWSADDLRLRARRASRRRRRLRSEHLPRSPSAASASATYCLTSSFCWSPNEPMRCIVRLASSALLALAIAVIAASSRLLPEFMYASTAAAWMSACATSRSCCGLRAPAPRSRDEPALQHVPLPLDDLLVRAVAGQRGAEAVEVVVGLVALREQLQPEVERQRERGRRRHATSGRGRGRRGVGPGSWSVGSSGRGRRGRRRGRGAGDAARRRARPGRRSGRATSATTHHDGLRASLWKSASRHRIFRRFRGFGGSSEPPIRWNPDCR